MISVRSKRMTPLFVSLNLEKIPLKENNINERIARDKRNGINNAIRKWKVTSQL